MTATRITRIEMKGFKSFANKTELLFGEKFNCILGPNGSGKSNVIDAICFVLGKSSAKGLRAEKSSNLIYNGGKLKNPAKEGIVSIYFDNAKKVFPVPENEVKITRIIHENGQSVYKISDKTRTRQQVLDLLSMVKINPDGHNIILQGDIIHLIEMSGLERRQIVEEIAGISVYEEKKDKALKELQRVEEKMNEAEIILTERKTYLGELKRERDHAMKFKELEDNIKRNKATLLSLRLGEKKEAIGKIEKLAGDVIGKIKAIDDEILGLKKDLEKRKKEIEDINQEVERRGEKEQVALHKEVEALKVDIAVKTQRIGALKAERQKMDDRRGELEKAAKDIEEKIQKAKAASDDARKRIKAREDLLGSLDQKIADFRKKNQLTEAADVDKRIDEIDKEGEKLQEEITRIRESQQALLREKDRLEIEIKGFDTAIDKVLAVEKEKRAEIEDLKQKKGEFKRTTLDLQKRLSDSSSIAAQLENARSTILSRKEELSKLKAKQSAISENVAGGIAIQKILELKSKEKGIHGTVSDIGTVSSQFSIALEVAAGPRIRSIIVENDQVAAKCIRYLKENRLGVATFLPLNKLSPPKEDEGIRNIRGDGIHGLATDLVQFKPQYKKVFEWVFGNTVVVDSIPVSQRIGIGKARMVTIDGDLIEKSGAMQGGFRKKDASGLGFQEKEVAEGMERLEHDIADLDAVIGSLEDKKRKNEEGIERLREFKANLEADILKIEKTLHLESGDLEASKGEKAKLGTSLREVEKKLDAVAKDVTARNKTLAALKIERQQLKDRITQMRNPRLLAELNTFEEKRKELLQEVSDIKGEIKNSESEIANILAPEKENIGKILKAQDKERAAFDKEKKDLEADLAARKKSLDDKEVAERKFYAQFKELFTKRQTLSNHVAKLEEKVAGRDREKREHEQKGNLSSLEMARLKAEFAGIEEEYKPYDGVPVFKGKAVLDIQKEIGAFEKMASDLGAVNMKALEIYDKVESEYRNLQEKKTSLGKEREDVLVMINEIDSKKKELFMRSYEVLQKNFKTIFSSLSTKGEAFLELENEPDPFAGGLSIKVRLVGKKFLDIRSLSGGEKTLTALAFLFAIQEHEPASFYVLDEVDAALDKRNSELLANLVKDYANKAQYVMISHNDQIISSADLLFGVSMTEHGMSKVTSLKI